MKTNKSGRSEQKQDYDVVKALMNKYVHDHTIKRKLTKPQSIIFDIIKNRERFSKKVSVKEFCIGLIKDKMINMVHNLPDDGYSMGSLITLTAGKVVVSHDYRKEYARSSNYSATHGGYNVSIKMSELKNFKVIGGVVTYIYPDQKTKIKKCWWYDGAGSKQYFRLLKKEGFLYGDFHGATIQDVKAKIALDKEYKRISCERQREQDKMTKLFNKFSRKQYGFQDSLDAGNCEVGTRAFVIRLKLDPYRKYRGTYLLNLAREKSNSSLYYIEKMIKFKALQI